MERKTGVISGLDYMIVRDMEVHALPVEVEMKPKQWYVPDVVQQYRMRREMKRIVKDGKR